MAAVAASSLSPTFGPDAWAGMAMQMVALSGLLTLVLAWVLLWRYRHAVSAWMLVAGERRVTEAATARAPQPAAVTLVASASQAQAGVHPASKALRRAGVVHGVAALAFGVAASALQLWAWNTEPSFNRLAIMVWTWAWPAVLVLGLVSGGDARVKRLAWALYFGVLLLICLRIHLMGTPPLSVLGVMVPGFFQGLVVWVSTLGFTPFLLLFLNRGVRSVGPPLLAMVLTASVGSALALVFSSTPLGMQATVRGLGALGVPVGAMLWVVQLLGLLLLAPLGWWVGRRLRGAYLAGWFTDQSLVIDAIWLFQAVLLSASLVHSLGPVGWAGLLVFGLHKAVTVAGLRPLAAAARTRRPQRLLLLRVFGRRAHSERLYDLLGAHWRYAGPVHLIGAPDLAASTLDPDEFLDFLAGRLRQRFVLDAAEVPQRLAAVDERCAFDGRYRVNEQFCGNDTWQPMVLALMARSDLVAMDLRGFGPQRQGCVFELQALLDTVPAARLALLLDASTDRAFLQTTLAQCAQRVAANSPNRHGQGQIRWLDCGAGEAAAVRALMAMAVPSRPDAQAA